MAVNGVEIAVGQIWLNAEGVKVFLKKDGAYEDRPFRSIYLNQTRFGAKGAGVAHHRPDGTCKIDDYKLMELVTDEHGFTIWKGGACPVPADAEVSVRFEHGHTPSRPQRAGDLKWAADPGQNFWRIVAYKVVEAAEQPAPTVDADKLASEALSALGWVFDGTTWVEQPKIEIIEGGIPVMAVPGYELLADVLHRAYNQAAVGKGKERHANGEPFDEQVMQDGARRFGVGALLFQAFKKSEESQRLPLERGVAELLGSIVYLAGAVIRREADDPTKGAF